MLPSWFTVMCESHDRTRSLCAWSGITVLHKNRMTPTRTFCIREPDCRDDSRETIERVWSEGKGETLVWPYRAPIQRRCVLKPGPYAALTFSTTMVMSSAWGA